jgi:hypothetical protein
LNANRNHAYKMSGSTEEYWGRQDAAQAVALVSLISLSISPH